MAKRRKSRVILPHKMSKLIKLALADIDKAEKSCNYAVDMATWHTPVVLTADGYNAKKEVCVVCAAGSVMAFSLKADPTKNLGTCHFPGNKFQLNAIEALRTGDVEYAAQELGLPSHRLSDKAYHEFNSHIENYCSDPAQFKKGMKALAGRLARAGL